MRIGFSVKELGEILGISPNHISQSLDPAMAKLAKLWMRNPTKTMALLLDTVNTLQRERLAKLNPTDMPDDEIEQRIAMATGTANKQF